MSVMVYRVGEYFTQGKEAADAIAQATGKPLVESVAEDSEWVSRKMVRVPGTSWLACRAGSSEVRLVAAAAVADLARRAAER